MDFISYPFFQNLIIVGGLTVAFFSGAEKVALVLLSMVSRLRAIRSRRAELGLLLKPTPEEIKKYGQSIRCNGETPTRGEQYELMVRQLAQQEKIELLNAKSQSRLFALSLFFAVAAAIIALRFVRLMLFP